MTHWFKILVATDKNWTCDEPECVIECEGLNPIRIRSHDTSYQLNEDLIWHRRDVDKIYLDLSSDGYSSFQAANDAASRVCNSLVIAAGHGLAVDPGFTTLLRGGIPWEVGEGIYVKRMSRYSGGGVTRKVASLANAISEFAKNDQCTVRQLRACANIANAILPNGLKTSLDFGYPLFMARISAIEALASNIDKNPRVRRFLDETIDQLESKEYLTDNDRSELKRTLGNAKKEPISAKCREFLNDHPRSIDMPPSTTEARQALLDLGQRFNVMYNMRSAFTHGSIGPEEAVNSLEDHDTARQCGLDAEDMIKIFLL